MPFVNPTTKPKSIRTPWAAVGPLKPPQSAMQEASDGVLNQNQKTFHHYLKKHMTMLHLKHLLDSSDSDSETDSNYQTKLFRRRQHPLKRAPNLADKEKLEIERRKKENPWTYHPPGVSNLGCGPKRVLRKKIKDAETGQFKEELVEVIPDGYNEDEEGYDRKRCGKRSFPEGHVTGKERQKNDGLAEPQIHKGKRLRPLEKYQARLAQGDYATTFSGPWDERTKKEEAERLFRKQNVTPSLEMFHPNPEALREQARSAELVRQTNKQRQHRSCSRSTAHSIGRVVDQIKKDHEESMARHRRIMDAVGGARNTTTPPLPSVKKQ